MRKQGLSYIEFSDSKRILRISTKALKTFQKYKQEEGTLESGGILFGNVYINNRRDEILKVTTPSTFDTRGFLFFNRSKISAQLAIGKYWKRSKGSLIYFGEWHTHTEINPKPTLQDKNMIKKALKETKMETDFLYMIIVGLNNTYWIGRQTNRRLTKFSKLNKETI